MVAVVRTWDDPPTDGSPWVADLRTFDIPVTIARCIAGAPAGLIAVTLSSRGGPQMIIAADCAARARGAVVLWWEGPDVPGDAERLDATIRNFVAAQSK
jgi:hypothetical protein